MRDYWGVFLVARAKRLSGSLLGGWLPGRKIKLDRALKSEVDARGGSNETMRFGDSATLTVFFVVSFFVIAVVSCDGKGARSSAGTDYENESVKFSSHYGTNETKMQDGFEKDSDRTAARPSDSENIQTAVIVPLEEALTEIESYEVCNVESTSEMPIIDPQIFELLKSELVKKLNELYGDTSRITSKPPNETGGKVADLSYNYMSNTLSWTYANLGDYDLSGEVGVSDITPLAQYYLANTTDGIGDDALEAWIDGNGDGEIGISDITTIAENFLCTVVGYKILTCLSLEDVPTQIGDIVPFGDIGAFPITFSETLPSGFQNYLAVMPTDESGNDGAISEWYEFPRSPNVLSVSPSYTRIGDETTLTAEVTGTEPITYNWEFKATGFETFSNDASPKVIFTKFGPHHCKLTVTNDGGSFVYDFDLFVWDELEPPKIISVSPLTCEDNVTVTFTTSVTGTANFSYAWDFGGGAIPNTSISGNPEVRSGELGAYDASLTVTNFLGSDTYDFKLNVIDKFGKPKIYNITPDGGFAGEQIQLNASVNSLGLNYAWDFKGACSPPNSTEKSPIVTLGTPGDFPISLTVSNIEGHATYEMTLIITDPTSPPVIRAVYPAEFTSGITTTFRADVRGMPPISYWWDFGGGAIPNTTSEASPTVVMRGEGTYNCALTVENAFGIDTLRWPVTVLPSWHKLVIDTEGLQGNYPSIALDSGGFGHFTYYDNTNYDLKYGFVSGSTWSKMTLDSTGIVGQHTSIALDSNDTPHIAYYDASNKNLKYASKSGMSWIIQTIDSVGDVGKYTSIAIDSLNRPHISYFDVTNTDLKHAYSDGGNWILETLDSENIVGYGTSIAIDSFGKIHIAYRDFTNKDLKHASFDGGAWSLMILDSELDTGINPSIALDSNGYPHISYGVHGNSGNYYMKYCYYTGSLWVDTVADGKKDNPNIRDYYGGITSIAVDSEGYPHLLYYDYVQLKMKLAHYANSRWNYEYPSTTMGEYAIGIEYSMKLNAANNPHIVYYEGWDDDFIYIWYG